MSTVEKTKANLLVCKCLVCPSYEFTCKVQSMPSNVLLLIGDMDERIHAEKLFCAYEKSSCIEQAKGCICGECKVQEKYGLTKYYYCLEDGGR
ncbi:MAG: DUF2769 domain-containing protein [Coriobacteriaceae bacterium]|nr:DUF2769 domain-containing protein [Coriobacteriaceae bacterium]